MIKEPKGVSMNKEEFRKVCILALRAMTDEQKEEFKSTYTGMADEVDAGCPRENAGFYYLMFSAKRLLAQVDVT